jgi:hypothetical protein
MTIECPDNLTEYMTNMAMNDIFVLRPFKTFKSP